MLTLLMWEGATTLEGFDCWGCGEEEEEEEENGEEVEEAEEGVRARGIHGLCLV